MSKEERKSAIAELKAIEKWLHAGELEYRRLAYHLESVHDPFINYIGEEALTAVHDYLENMRDKYIELEEKLEKLEKSDK
jgi:hypothetical protein